VAGQLQGFCVKGLRVEHHVVVAARIHTGEIKSAGAIIGYSASQTRHWWDRAKEYVLVPLGLPEHDDALAGLWIMLHATCCTAPVFLLLKNDVRFASESG
jgi:hypothetical protein